MRTAANGTFPFLAGDVTSRLYNLATAPLTLTNELQAAGFIGANNANIFLMDLADCSQVRLTTRVTTASASVNTPKLRLLFSTTFTTTFGSYLQLGATQVEHSIFTAVTYGDSGWINIVPAARINSCFIALTSIGGDGAADPVVTNICMHIR